MDWIWVLIPIAAMLVPVAKQWLKMKEQTARLGHSAHDLRQDMDRISAQMETLSTERDRLVQRVQHLEAIVTDEAWDVLGDDAELAASKTQVQLPIPEDLTTEDENEQRAAAIARRLRG
jgi:hypothetical protein